MKPIRLNGHARQKLEELEQRYGIRLDRSDIEIVLGNPDWSDPDTEIAETAEKWYKGQPIRIVYVERQDFILIVTAMVITRGSHI